MSSQSGSEYNSRKGNNKSKKTKAEPILQKRTRRSNRKIDQGEESENVLPSNIPITESEDLTIYHSLELELAKTIIQIPVLLFRKPKMQKQAQIRVGQSVLQVQISKNELGQLLVNAKIKSQTSVIKEQKKNGSNRQQAIEVQKQQQNGDSKEKCNDEQSEQGEQCTYLVWGKACWIGAHQILSKTIKQSPKILNSQIFLQIIKVKTKQVNSDIFLIVNTRKKIECVADHNGLINQGNTCYMNSYLQMLSHISQFKNLVFQASLVDQNKFPATLQLLFHKLDNQQKPVSAEQLVKSFGWSKKDTNIQQDAEQFSCLFYDALERKLQQACPNPKHMNMSQMFQGKLRNLIQCLDVGNPFFNISLSLSTNLQRSLDDYVAEQELSGDNLYNTQFYGPQRAKKSVRFLSLPPIIMVQLKRFQFNYISNKNQKILHHFQYPDMIDFSVWQVSSDQQCLYQLYAVLVHEGIKAESGHYYAYVKVMDDWYRFNDQQVSRASKLQVFDYNFGGQIDVFEFDARQFKVFNRKTVCTSTAYMLVYVKQDLKQRLLHSEPIYPEWLQEHQIMKQGQRQQIRIRKNFYHDIQILEWETHFNNTIADFLGIILKNCQQLVGKVIPKISKTDRVDEWVKPLNQKGIGSYLYLVSFEKTEYETLVNMQHRKCTFQDLIREPNCAIIMINMPLIAKADSLLYFIKIASPQMKMSEDEESEYELKIRFDQVLEINRNSKNSELTIRLKELYLESGYELRFFYEEKKQLIEIKDDKSLIRGPQMQRNILGIIIVQKVPEQLENKMMNTTISWYNDLKNFVPIKIKSEDGRYQFDTEMDQNRSVQSLRQYIFHEKIQGEDACSASDNIVLKAKLKKTAKNYVEVTNAKTIRDLIKNCDKQNIIVFSFSNLKADERKNQIEIKFMYRFPDFTFSEMFHVILDRKSQNQSSDIYQKIAEHEEVQNYKKNQQVQGIRIFLFSKDKNVINDIVFENGHVHGKGEIAQVLQKQKGSHLVVQGFPVPKIQQQICPILLHHRSQNDEKIGTPRYLQFNRAILLTQIYNQIQEMIKDEEYEWEQKKIKCNIMKLFIYAYYKDYSKGIELVDQARLEQEEKDRIKQCKRKQKQKLQMRQQIQVETDKKQEEMGAKNQQKSNAMDVQQSVKKQCIIVIDEQDSQKNNQKIDIEKLLINNGNGEEEKGSDQNRKQSQTRKNSKCEPKVQPWEKTLDLAFPKVKLLKIVVKHTYLTKSQTVMKINVQ